MAERRMISKKIFESDSFLEMPLSTQALYFHLLGRADDDGFLNNAGSIMRTIGANTNDYDILIAKRFLIQFPDGVCVIKHWRIHNYVRGDRYKPTQYEDEKSMLTVKKNGAYTLENECGTTNGIPDGYRLDTQVRLGKVRLGKVSNKESSRFAPPTPEQIDEYCKEKNYKNVNAERFISFYESKDWMIGKNKMKNWKAAVSGWDIRSTQESKPKKNSFGDYQQNNYDFAALEKELGG